MSDTPYYDIIHLPNHISKKHPRMSRLDRAAQFAPFAALTGFEDCIRDAGIVTEELQELGPDSCVELDRCLQYLTDHLDENPHVCVNYFVPNSGKPGRAYHTVNGSVRKILIDDRLLLLGDGTTIPWDYVIAISPAE